jgi:hypothetical protein
LTSILQEKFGVREESTPHKNIMRNKKESVQITLTTVLVQRVKKLLF